jgi:hypothetical protein
MLGAGLPSWSATSHRSANAGLVVDSASLLGVGSIATASGTALTRSTTNAVSAYSSIVTWVACLCVVGPSAVGIGGAGVGRSFSLIGTDTLSSPSMGVWWYETDNLSASASGAVTVYANYSSAEAFSVSSTDVRLAATLGFDAIGAGGKNAASLFGSDNVTTTVGNDAVLSAIVANNAALTTTLGCGATSGVTGLNVNTGKFVYRTIAQATNPPIAGPVQSCVTWSASAAWLCFSLAIKSALVPAAPTGLTVGTVTTTTVPLSWTPQVGPELNATVYRAAYSAGSCGLFTTAYNVGAVRSYTVTGLTTGQAVCFKVATWNATGQGALAATGLVVTAEVPNAPTGLSGLATLTSIAWSWTLPSGGGILNGTLYLQTGCVGPWVGSNVVGTATTWTSTGLASHTTFCAMAAEWNGTGQSLDSAVATNATNVVPAAPTGLTATGATLTSIAWSWTLPSGGGILNGTFQDEPFCVGPWSGHPIAGTGTTYILTGLSTTEKVCAFVTAWNATGQSPESSPAVGYAARVPAAPSAVHGSVSVGTMVVAWSLPSGGGLVNVTVYLSVGCGPRSTGTSTGSGATVTHTFGGLPPLTAICVSVTAWNATGESVRSTVLNLTTPASGGGGLATFSLLPWLLLLLFLLTLVAVVGTLTRERDD